MVPFRRLSLCLIAAAALYAGPAAAENRAYFSLNTDPRLPECTAASVQSAVAGTLARAQLDYSGGRTITGITHIRETGYKVNGISPLARRYCRGKASLSDGSTRSVHYMVEEHAGFVGVSWNVEACIAPLDKWHIYGAYCSTTRPR